MGNENKFNILIKNVNGYQSSSSLSEKILNSGLYDIKRISNKTNPKCTLTKNGKTFNLNLIDINKKTKYIEKYYQKAHCIILEFKTIDNDSFEDFKSIWSKDIKNMIKTNLIYLITIYIETKNYYNKSLFKRIKKYTEDENIKYFNINKHNDIKVILDNLLIDLEKGPNNINEINNEIIIPTKEEYKVVFVGDTYSSCKSSFIATIMQEKKFDDDMLSNYSGNYQKKKITLKNGYSIILYLWDIIGQERYNSLAKILIKDYDCAVIGYDITNKESFYDVKNLWHKLVLETGNSDLMYLIGHKSDLYEKQMVSTEEAKELADELNMRFFEVSCKEYYNIKEFIDDLTNEIIKV